MQTRFCCGMQLFEHFDAPKYSLVLLYIFSIAFGEYVEFVHLSIKKCLEFGKLVVAWYLIWLCMAISHQLSLGITSSQSKLTFQTILFICMYVGVNFLG